MAESKVGFQTALFGFQKKDVLTCIDKLSAEALEQQEKAKQEMQLLSESLDALRSEKEKLLHEGAEKDVEISRLNGEIEEKQTQILAEQEKLQALAEELRVAQVAARDYKSRLFTQEETAVLLRSENAQLTQSLSNKRREVESAEAQVQIAQQMARDEIEAANQRAVQAQNVAKTQMQGSASEMLEDLATLKNDLAVLDRRLVDSMEEMQRSTQALAQALQKTEHNVERLGVRLLSFPETQQKTDVLTQLEREGMRKQQTKKKASKTAQPLSELLLAKLTQLLGE